MLNKLLKLKNNKKGFTLVEVIVVLVILAILAAILIPSLTGYIDKANEKRYIAEARSLLVAAQTIISEKYGTVNNGTFTAGKITITAGVDATTPATDLGSLVTGDVTDIIKLAEMNTDTSFNAVIPFDANGQITKGSFEYKKGSYTVTFVNGAWDCAKA